MNKGREGQNTSIPELSLTFAPAWWHTNYDIDFGEQHWHDPILRTECDREMRRLLFERFGDVGLGERNPKPQPNVEAYGHRFMAAFWGCDIVYETGSAPSALVLPNAQEKLRSCVVPDVNSSPVVQKALEDARLLEKKYGWCDGNINFGGPLNNAVSVFGDSVLSAIALEPKTASLVLNNMAKAIMEVYEKVLRAVNRLPKDTVYQNGGIGNCPVCMISPESYQNVVLPADLWYRQHFVNFGIHHCGALHPYLDVYRSLKPNSFDVGWLSNRRMVRQAYPDLPVSLMMEASVLTEKTLTELDDLLLKMVEEAGPDRLITRIWVADAGNEVSDALVHHFMTAGQRIFNC